MDLHYQHVGSVPGGGYVMPFGLGLLADNNEVTREGVTPDQVDSFARAAKAEVEAGNLRWWTTDSVTQDTASDEKTIELWKAGAVGDDDNPRLRIRLQNAGINRVEVALEFTNDALAGEWIKVFGHEITGTLAAVRDGTLGSCFEAFLRDGYIDPAFRASLYPWMGVEFGPNGGRCPAGNLTRASGVVTAQVEDSAGNPIPHCFQVGKTVNLNSSDPLFSGGAKTVTGTPGFDTFTYAEAGTDGSNAGAVYFSGPTDVRLERNTDGALLFKVNGNAVAILYPDALVMQAGSLLVHSTVNNVTAHAGGGQASATQLTSELNFVTTAASAGDSVRLPFAGPGRVVTVFNDGANAIDVFPLSTEAIDALGADTAYSLAAGASRQFFGKSAGVWRSA